jgi:quercetin dioxygenase-like cupin family protein
MGADVTITVLDVNSITPEAEGAASVRRFLNAETVGARLVEGMAYQLPQGERYEPEQAGARHQVFYVTSGRIRASYQGAQYDLKAGGGVYCEPGESCQLEATGDSPASFYRLLVQPS